MQGGCNDKAVKVTYPIICIRIEKLVCNIHDIVEWEREDKRKMRAYVNMYINFCN